jgi:hypothetical protein
VPGWLGHARGRTLGARRFRPVPLSLPLVLFLAVAIHVDWHGARPHHYRLSLAWPYHWLLGVAAFALAAAYVVYRWPDDLWEASAVNIVAGVFAGIIVIPAATTLYYQHRLEVASAAEWSAFTQFATAGLLTYLVAVPVTVRCFARLRAQWRLGPRTLGFSRLMTRN